METELGERSPEIFTFPPPPPLILGKKKIFLKKFKKKNKKKKESQKEEKPAGQATKNRGPFSSRSGYYR